MTLLRPRFVWFSYDLDGAARKIGIYQDGVVFTLTNVAYLDEKDSAVFLETQKKIAHSASGNYEVEMQNILRAYYGKILKPIQLPATF